MVARVFFKYTSDRTGVRLNYWIGGEPAEWTATVAVERSRWASMNWVTRVAADPGVF
jgi:hypothetical protein